MSLDELPAQLPGAQRELDARADRRGEPHRSLLHMPWAELAELVADYEVEEAVHAEAVDALTAVVAVCAARDPRAQVLWQTCVLQAFLDHERGRR